MRCNDLDYDGMTCRPQKDKTFTDYCWVGFVKITFDRRQLFTEQELDVDKMVAALNGDLTWVLPVNALKDVRIYTKMVNYEGISVIDYIVVQFNLDVYFKRFVNRLNGRFCSIGHSYEIAFCEFEVYEPTNDLDDLLYVPNPNELTTEALRPIGLKIGSTNTDMCTDKPVRVINKLVFCIHIELREDEFDMEIRNTFLVIKENSKEFTFSRWKYEKIDQVVKLCLDDYLTVYKSMLLKRQLGDEPGDMSSDLKNGDTFEMPLHAVILSLIAIGVSYMI